MIRPSVVCRIVILRDDGSVGLVRYFYDDASVHREINRLTIEGALFEVEAA